MLLHTAEVVGADWLTGLKKNWTDEQNCGRNYRYSWLGS